MKVTIEPHRGVLRLRFDDGKRRCISLGVADSPVGRALALQKKGQIELDWQIGQYDRSLLKYKNRILGKNPTEITTVELFDRFARYKAKAENLKQSTLDAHYKPICRMLEKFLNVCAADVDKKSVSAFTDICQKTLKGGTAKQRLSLLKHAWDWGKGQYHLSDDNPWDGVAARFRVEDPRPTASFSKDEIRKILDGFRNSQYYSHFADFVQFQLGCATRPGEAAGLKWKNVIDYQFKRVWIGESFSRGVYGETKTGKTRTFPLSPSISQMLIDRYDRLKPKPEDLVFTTKTGLPIDDRNFRRRAWKQVLEAVGVNYRKPYSTRRTATSHALASGQNYIRVANAAGHSPEILHKHYADDIESGAIFVDFD